MSFMKTGVVVLVLTVLGFAGYHYLSKSSTTEDASSASNYSSEVVQEWIDLQLTLTKSTPGFSPPVAARAFGYTGLSLYESVRFGIPNSKSLAGQVNGFEETLLADIDVSAMYNWNIVANANLARMATELYSNTSTENKALIAALEERLLSIYSQGIDEQIVTDSISLGQAVAGKMIIYANSDGQKDGYAMNFPVGFEPQEGEGLWVPTPDTYMGALQPYWGNTRPFLTENIAGTLPPAPPEYSLESGSLFFTETEEVYETVQNLTEEERTIAEFWSDDPGATATPPGHSVSILKEVLEQENASLDTAAVSFAKLGMGLHDAFVACWYAKYTYNLIRPITVIHEHIDADFVIPLNTPPFPEYPSGHSVQSGAAAQILTDLFGQSYTFTDSTHAERTDIDGSPRTFESFYAFAEEAAISRLYGGIHFRSAIDLGVDQGKEIGKNIGRLSFTN